MGAILGGGVELIARYLYVLRHAKSSWDDPTLDDHDRPLNHRGRQAAQQLAKHFRLGDIRPELVLCSSAVRARETLAPIATEMQLDDRILIESSLYGASLHQLLVRLRGVDRGVTSVLLIGHNPGLQDLAIELGGVEPEFIERLRSKFPTGALARIVVDSDGWSDIGSGNARVTSLTVPRDLPE